MMRAVALALLVLSVDASAASPANEWPTNSFEAEPIHLLRNQLGDGSPAASATRDHELGLPVADGYYHSPQYLAGYPTAATIWPRVLSVPCKMVNEQKVCDGFHWRPELGRGEYLFVRPVVQAAAPPPPEPQIIYVPYTPAEEPPSLLDFEPGAGIPVEPLTPLVDETPKVPALIVELPKPKPKRKPKRKAVICK